MAVFKCKMCGATLNIEEDKHIVECAYCGTKQTVPVIKTKEIEELYDRANYFFHNNEYDKAASIYENISTENPYDPESYFMLSLCKYGIEYVEDPKSKKRIPTLHRLHYESIFNDINFKKAIKHADSTQKILYEQEAKYIDEVRNKILDISKKEKPYDVFICYKETDEKGQRTEDSVLAMDIYNELTKEGLKVFFSKVTLEDKLGIDYEPYIFAALNSAKVMVVVGTKPEYINSPWVRNEWTRFLDRINKNKSSKKNVEQCYIVPAYKNMSPYALPNEFSSVQAQDMSKVGAIQDLVHGIKKLINKDGLSVDTYNSKFEVNKKLWKMAIVVIIPLLLISIFLVMSSNKKIIIRDVGYNVHEAYDVLTLQGISDLNKKDISQLKKIKSIKNLYFKDCAFENLDFLSDLTNIKGVEFDSSSKVNNCKMEKIAENIETFKIDAHEGKIWENIEFLKNMPNLKEVYVPLCEDLVPISNHKKLDKIELYPNNQFSTIDNFLWCKGLEKVTFLKLNGNISTGKIRFTGKDTLFKGIENLKSLNELILTGSMDGYCVLRQKDIDYISNLVNLQKIDIKLTGKGEDIYDKKYYIKLSNLQKMKKLKHLNISAKNNFDLNGIGDLSELDYLELGPIYNDNLKKLNGLNKLTSLSFELQGKMEGKKNFSLSGVEYLQNLKVLKVNMQIQTKNIELLDEELVNKIKGLNYQVIK